MQVRPTGRGTSLRIAVGNPQHRPTLGWRVCHNRTIIAIEVPGRCSQTNPAPTSPLSTQRDSPLWPDARFDSDPNTIQHHIERYHCSDHHWGQNLGQYHPNAGNYGQGSLGKPKGTTNANVVSARPPDQTGQGPKNTVFHSSPPFLKHATSTGVWEVDGRSRYGRY